MDTQFCQWVESKWRAHRIKDELRENRNWREKQDIDRNERLEAVGEYAKAETFTPEEDMR
jgi:hypothetical protein